MSTRTAAARAQIPWHWGAPPRASVPARTAELGPPITRTAVTRADPGSLMMWVAQLRRAPYSYDWIDNFGRRSPRRPDPALRDLESGDPLMYIFTVTGYGERHVEAKMTSRVPRAVFGEVVIRYDVHEVGTASVLQHTMWRPATRFLARIRRYLLAWADLPMARKQLLTLIALAQAVPVGQYDRPTPTKE